ncbi:SPL family radical SAM protein [Alkalicoccobacillus porphyridii]|uniref:Radical SAM protein n=1 Tax=Alkalicoccobacillus porphyridii TaxID=2597270 RepID=A0A553ZW87_9BACI|nr:radical SAM protein [Alkalicoccobacillus porphyridii]TSB45740.1 radical SAM protein [Alkalicoccobacillus porphyridii]
MKNITHKQPKTLLNKGSGFLKGYSHSLNPYAGCAFACSYCYVRKLPVQTFRSEDWGTWVDVKTGAAEVLRKELIREQKKGPVSIFMSSSTDPYQPLEHKEQITRSLLIAMSELQPDFLFVQTRSPLVTRDIDLLKQLGDRVRVSMTIETDSDDMRKHFSPQAPPIQARLRSLGELTEAGIATQATIAPLLPSSRDFANALAKVTDRVCVDDFFMGDGSGGRRTEKLKIYEKYQDIEMEKWYQRDAYKKLVRRLEKVFDKNQIYISQDGFMP